MSNFLRSNNTLKAVATGVVGSVALTGCGISVQADSDRYRGYEVPRATGIEICDGAIIRNGPHRNNNPDMFEEGVRVATIDFGNAPEGTCVTVPASTVYERTEPHNGAWYGVTERYLAAGLTDTGFNSNGNNILWINEQRSGVVLSDTEK